MEKKRGRPPLQTPKIKEVQINETVFQEAVLARDAEAIAQEVFTPSRAALHEAMGRMKAMKAVSSITAAISLKNLKIIKESKEYRMLKGQPGATPDGQPIADLGTWDGFCRSLGMSPDKADEDLRNLVVFGQEALDRMSALGAGYRDLRQYRELPDDKRQALVEVAKSGDKTDFIELAEEIIAKHAKEKEALLAKIEEAEADLEAKDKVLADKAEQILGLEEKAYQKFKPRADSEAKTLAEQNLIDEIDSKGRDAVFALKRLFMVVDPALDGSSSAAEMRARQTLDWVSQELVDIANKFNITLNFEELLPPPWMSEKLLDEIEARQRERIDKSEAKRISKSNG